MRDNPHIPDYMKTIGRNIKHRRIEKGLTQADLAIAMNYSPGHISHIECGSRGMAVDTLLAFCDALDTNCNSLVTDSHTTAGGKEGELEDICDLLRDRPEEYINVVKSFILSLDTLIKTTYSQKEGERQIDDGTVLV